jgi:hypothetical protein
MIYGDKLLLILSSGLLAMLVVFAAMLWFGR